jgi:hypothetical protein
VAITDIEVVARKAALTRLAMAVRERLPEDKQARDAFFSIYLSGKLLDFSTDTFVKACARLEDAIDWFPKKHDLVEACEAVARYKADSRPKLPEHKNELTPEQWQDIRDRLQAMKQRKAMP